MHTLEESHKSNRVRKEIQFFQLFVLQAYFIYYLISLVTIFSIYLTFRLPAEVRT